jgi:plastocyanin
MRLGPISGIERTARIQDNSSTAVPTVNIDNSMQFTPAELVVAPGATVTFANNSVNVHNVVSFDDDPSGYPLFETQVFGRGRSETIVAPTQPGRYRYYCMIHGTMMTGTVVVEAPVR